MAFPGNADVIYAVAEGYSGIGLPREAVALYKAQDLTAAPAREVEAAVVAATAAHDFRAAGNWARMGLQRFGGDPEMLTVVAELEQAKGHEGRALTLTEQAKASAPAENPGEVLAAELKEAKAGQGWAVPSKAGGQLSVLLAPAEAKALGSGQVARPYLPALRIMRRVGSRVEARGRRLCFRAMRSLRVEGGARSELRWFPSTKICSAIGTQVLEAGCGTPNSVLASE